MKKIKITEAQAKMLKEMDSSVIKGKILKVSESQYKMIQEMEKLEMANEDMLAGVSVPQSSLPSNKVTKNFSKSLDKGVGKEIGKLYEDFINEVYGLNEGGESKYEKLISLMEAAGLIENSRLKKDKFGGNKAKVKNVMCHGLNEMEQGASDYNVMEAIEGRINEYESHWDTDDAPWNEKDDASPVEVDQCIRATQFPLKMIYSNPDEDGVAVFSMGNEIYIHFSANLSDEDNEYCGAGSIEDADSERSNNFINDAYSAGKLKIGNNPFKHILSIITPMNIRKIEKYYGNDKALMKAIGKMDETTSAGSSGSFVAPLAGSGKFDSNVPDELQETSTTTSVGGDSGSFAYDAPVGDGGDFWTAGNKQNKKMNEGDSDEERDARFRYTSLLQRWKKSDKHERADMKDRLLAAAKVIGITLDLNENAMGDTQYPGGEFVKLDDCTKLNNNKVAQNGGCSQGDSGVVKTNKTKGSVIAKESVFAEVARRTGKTIKEVKEIIQKNK
jgi:hypothetical protein